MKIRRYVIWKNSVKNEVMAIVIMQEISQVKSLSVAQCAVETNLSKLSRVRIERQKPRSSDADGSLILVARDNNNKKYPQT